MSEEIDGEIHIDEQDAAGGSKEGVVRWVLLVSLLAAILVLSIIWITGALTSDNAATDADYADEEAFPPLDDMETSGADTESVVDGTTIDDAAEVDDAVMGDAVDDAADAGEGAPTTAE